jgi:hypothetical protein
VVDDFGIKSVDKEHAGHLIATLQEKYTITEDWPVDLYIGLKLLGWRSN